MTIGPSVRGEGAAKRLCFRHARGTIGEKVVERVAQKKRGVLMKMYPVAVESPSVANASARVGYNGIRGVFRAERAGEPGAAILDDGERIRAALRLGRIGLQRSRGFRVHHYELNPAPPVRVEECPHPPVVRVEAMAMRREENEHRERGTTRPVSRVDFRVVDPHERDRRDLDSRRRYRAASRPMKQTSREQEDQPSEAPANLLGRSPHPLTPSRSLPVIPWQAV